MPTYWKHKFKVGDRVKLLDEGMLDICNAEFGYVDELVRSINVKQGWYRVVMDGCLGPLFFNENWLELSLVQEIIADTLGGREAVGCG